VLQVAQKRNHLTDFIVAQFSGMRDWAASPVAAAILEIAELSSSAKRSPSRRLSASLSTPKVRTDLLLPL